MTMGRHPRGRRAAPRGVWLAVLAIAGQALLPFLLAVEIALAAPQIDGESGAALCLASHHDALPTPPGSNRTGRHAPPVACPICQALATAHLFTQPAAIALALPRISTTIVQPSAPCVRSTVASTTPYQSRAPPSSI